VLFVLSYFSRLVFTCVYAKNVIKACNREKTHI
jgi:hypothetical protein